jgi:DNA-binding transcriptional MerR regulator
MVNEQGYSISELANLAGVTPRTIRYYVSIGLLASPGRAGPGTRYSDGHLQRLRLIRKLQREHLPLGDIGSRLQDLDDEDVERLLETDISTATPGSALDYIRQLREEPEAGDATARDDRIAGSPAPARAGIEALTAALTSAPAPTAPTASTTTNEPPLTLRSQWERVALSQNVELHIRKPLGRLEKKRVDRLIHIAHELLEEDQS